MNCLHHCFPVRGRIEQCWLFVYRTPAEDVRNLLPSMLAPVLHGGFAFWNIVVSRLDAMRPAPFPECAGLGYWHVAYRLHAFAITPEGERVEGLYFVRSDCDRTIVARPGNWLTNFNFHVARIRVAENADAVQGAIDSSAARARFRIDRHAPAVLAGGSPFGSLAQAASALEYPPRALAPRSSDTVSVLPVVRDSSAWRWKPVHVQSAEWQFLSRYHAVLEVCYEVAPIDYLWERGRAVRVQACAS